MIEDLTIKDRAKEINEFLGIPFEEALNRCMNGGKVASQSCRKKKPRTKEEVVRSNVHDD